MKNKNRCLYFGLIVIAAFNLFVSQQAAAGATASWGAINTGLDNLNVQALALDPANPNTVYAGTYGGGRVYKTTNGGASWSAVNTGLNNQYVNALAIDPANPNTVYAGDYNNSAYKTTDGGANWSNTSLGYPGVYVLAVDPANPTTVYAGTYYNSVYKTTDGGVNWSIINSGLENLVVGALAIDPTNPDTVYAGTAGNPNNASMATTGGIFKTTNGGASWSAINTGLANTDVILVNALVIDPADTNTVYAGTVFGVYKTINGGASWNNIGLFGVRTLAIDPTNPNTVYAGTPSGVYQTTDGGTNWSPIFSGFIVTAITIDPSNPNVVYVGTAGGGVYKGNIVTPTIKRPVVIIPGIMGTELDRKDYTNEVWLNPLYISQTFDSFLFPLLLQKDGITPDTHNYCEGNKQICTTMLDCPLLPLQACVPGGTDIEAEGPLNVLLPPPLDHFNYTAYTQLADYLSINGGYQKHVDLFTYGYDWRLDLASEAKKLHDYLTNQSVFPDQSVKVDVIAHSMGGLLMRAYLKSYPGDQRVNSVIYLGTPQRGAPLAYAKLKGMTSLEDKTVLNRDAKTFINLDTETFLVQHFPGVYDLLPQFKFIMLADTDTTPVFETLQDSFKSLSTPSLVTKANNLYTNGLAGPDGVPRSFGIYGTAHRTLWGIDYTNPACPKGISDPRGDGTVPAVSYDFLDPNVQMYVNEDHADLPGNSFVEQQVLNILDGQENVRASGILSSLVADSDGWRWFSCSPIRTHVIDDAGNINGFDPDGNLHEEIPDSMQLEFTENEGGFMPFAKTYTVNIDALDNGLFTLEFDHIAPPNDGTVGSTSYKGIPISSKSHAQLTLSPTNIAPELHLDVDGDGVYDFTIPANTPPGPDVFGVVLINVIQSYGLPQGISKSLLTKLRSGARALQSEDRDDAREQLRAFLHEVSALRGKKLNNQQANTLTELATAAIQAIAPADDAEENGE